MKKAPGKPDFFSVSGSAVAAGPAWGQPPMPHPVTHAGQVPAPPAVPCPAGTGGQQPGTAVSGPGIGVPVSMWPHAPVTGTHPGRGPCASCGGRTSGPDTTQIITAFSRPGEPVVLPSARDGVLLAAAAAAGRRALGLAPGPLAYERILACLGGLDPKLRPLAEVRPGGPDLLLEAGCPEAGQAALAITGPGEPAPPGGSSGAGEPARPGRAVRGVPAGAAARRGPTCQAALRHPGAPGSPCRA